MKRIDEISHDYRYKWTVPHGGCRHQFIEIDEHNSLFRDSVYCKLHMDRKGNPYIWYKKTTYYL